MPQIQHRTEVIRHAKSCKQRQRWRADWKVAKLVTSRLVSWFVCVCVCVACSYLWHAPVTSYQVNTARYCTTKASAELEARSIYLSKRVAVGGKAFRGWRRSRFIDANERAGLMDEWRQRICVAWYIYIYVAAEAYFQLMTTQRTSICMCVRVYVCVFFLACCSS